MEQIEFCQNSSLPSSNLSVLPFQISFNGQTDVEEYFGNGDKTSFRGRALIPSVSSIPEGFKGVVVSKKDSNWVASREFSQLRLFYRDQIDSASFTELKAGLAYLQLSNHI